MNAPPQQPAGTASLSDILTAIKNLVTALNGAAQAYLQVNGKSTTEGITTPTVVKTTPGRVSSVSVIVGGSSGKIYDSAVLGVTTAPMYVLPTTVGVYVVNLPADAGILVVPGAGQDVTVSWS